VGHDKSYASPVLIFAEQKKDGADIVKTRMIEWWKKLCNKERNKRKVV